MIRTLVLWLAALTAVALVFLLYQQVKPEALPTEQRSFPFAGPAQQTVLRVNPSCFDSDNKLLANWVRLRWAGNDFFSLLHQLAAPGLEGGLHNHPFYLSLGPDSLPVALFVKPRASADELQAVLAELFDLQTSPKAWWTLQRTNRRYYAFLGNQGLWVSPSQRALTAAQAWDKAPAMLTTQQAKVLQSADHGAPINLFAHPKQVLEWLPGQARWPSTAESWAAFDLYWYDRAIHFTGLSNSPVSAPGTQAPQLAGLPLPANLMGLQQQPLPDGAQFLESRFAPDQRAMAKALWLPHVANHELRLQLDTHAELLCWAIDSAETMRQTLLHVLAKQGMPEQKWNIDLGTAHYPVFGLPTMFLPRNLAQSANPGLLLLPKWAVLGSRAALEQWAKAYDRAPMTDATANTQLPTLLAQTAQWRYFAQGQQAAGSFVGSGTAVKATGLADFARGMLQTHHRDGWLVWTGLLEKPTQTNNTLTADWLYPVPKPIASKTSLLLNHYTKNLDVLAQDQDGTLYLLDDKGALQWQRPIGERMMGTAQQVDLFRNGKLQFVFNTTNKIYCIDRLGRDVAPFPIDLPYPATNALAVFDYENDKNYRFVVACLNRRLYAYDREAKAVDGWQSPTFQSEVIHPAQHFVVEGKDYLVVTDADRLYLLNRRGEERVQLKQSFRPSANNLFSLEPNPAENKPYWVGTDVAGNVLRVYPDGTVQARSMQAVSANHFFLYADLNADGLNDYVLADNRQLWAVNQLFEPVLSLRFTHQILDSPVLFRFAQQKKLLGVYARQEQAMHLYGPSGKALRGLPIPASAPASIGRLRAGEEPYYLLCPAPGRGVASYVLP